MKEFKTLEDFNIMAKTPHRKNENWINIGDIKEEAIKWIKSKEIVICNEAVGIPAHIIKAIQDAERKHFFNITEEDLK